MKKNSLVKIQNLIVIHKLRPVKSIPGFKAFLCWFQRDCRAVLLTLKVLTLSWRRSLSYRNQSIDLQSKSFDWFLYDRDLRHERIKSQGKSFKAILRGTQQNNKVLLISFQSVWEY